MISVNFILRKDPKFNDTCSCMKTKRTIDCWGHDKAERQETGSASEKTVSDCFADVLNGMFFVQRGCQRDVV